MAGGEEHNPEFTFLAVGFLFELRILVRSETGTVRENRRVLLLSSIRKTLDTVFYPPPREGSIQLRSRDLITRDLFLIRISVRSDFVAAVGRVGFFSGRLFASLLFSDDVAQGWLYRSILPISVRIDALVNMHGQCSIPRLAYQAPLSLTPKACKP